MIGRLIVRIGDRTSHGGTVLQGFPFHNIEGRAAAGMGHMVDCPQCKGSFPIVQGVPSFSVDGVPVAVEGMQTACGAVLIASQNIAVLDPGPGGVRWAASDTGGLANGFMSSAGTGRPLSNGLRQEACNHPDALIGIAEYMVREMKTNPFSIEGRKIRAANSADPQARREEWQQLPWYLRLEGQPDFEGAAAGQKVAAYGMWIERVGPGRPWDHKPALERMLGKNFNIGWQKYGNFDYFFDIWSNIHYGYAGVALGFSAAELINGAGLAQAAFDAWVKRRQQNHPQNGPWPASADDVPDHISIKLGADLYNEVKPHALTVGILLQKIEDVPLPWGAGSDRAKRVHECNGG
ncbi:PAAR domain-containing protein [Achromobacter sp. NPDC058515]|uniref:PAAR domain-containing protein n=1 Tax=Achromobacter sp. NPDC058515 TaxID=3346533 RepID=UPI003668D874